MKIHYATRAAIPYPSAACLNTVQMCQSLAELGHQVTLIAGRKMWRFATWAPNWTRDYGFQPAFRIRRFWELPRIGFWFDRQVAATAKRDEALVYLRYARLLPALRARSVPTILELHSRLTPHEMLLVAESLANGHLLGIVSITHQLRDYLTEQRCLSSFGDRILVASDAVELSRFSDIPRELDLTRAGYVGSVYPGKGMELIGSLAKYIPELAIDVYGGPLPEVRRWNRQLANVPNVHLHGPIQPVQVPGRLSQFGIALLPNQPRIHLPNGDDIGQFTSPMKLFEYMAAGRVIVASNLPAMREVLQHQRNCLLVPHDSPMAWADAIRELQSRNELANRLAAQARQDAETCFSFRRRFDRILTHFLGTFPSAHDSNRELAA